MNNKFGPEGNNIVAAATSDPTKASINNFPHFIGVILGTQYLIDKF